MLFAAAMVCAAHPAYVLKPVVSTVIVQRTGSKFRATASLKFIVLRKTRGATVAAIYADHVRGHEIIADRVAKSSIGKYESIAATATLARAQVKRAMAQMTSDAQKDLDREERVYDQVSAYGVQQDQAPLYGFPGGADVPDPCPNTTS